MAFGLVARPFFFARDVVATAGHPEARAAVRALAASHERPHAPSFEALRTASATDLPPDALTWGETPVSVALGALRAAGVGPGSRVVDLGAGRGAVLIAARLLGADANGCEIDRRRAEAVGAALARCGARLDVGDARSWDLGAPTHAWLAWTTWPAPLRAAVAGRLAALPRPPRLLSITWGPPAPFRPIAERRLFFPWGAADLIESRHG